jgi:hypothetical protein
MLKIIFILLFSFTTNNNIYAMDLSTKTNRLKRRSRTFSVRLTKSSDKIEKRETTNNKDILISILERSYNKIINDNKDTLLIIAARNNDEETVDILLKQKDIYINHQNKWGNTALLQALISNNITITNKLLAHPATDSSLVNTENLCAHGYACNDYSLRTQLFVRTTIDRLVKEEAQALWLSNDNIAIGIQNIKNRFNKDRDNQESYMPLPKETLLPDYIDDLFIERMLEIYLNKLRRV